MRTASHLLLAVLLSGCTTYGATNSPVTDQNAVEPPGLAGRWLGVEPTSGGDVEPDSVTLDVTPLAPGRFRAIISGCEHCRPVPMVAQFTRLDGELFAALRRELADTAEDSDDAVLVLYQFYRVRFRNESLFVAALDPDSLRAFLRAHPAALPFTELQGNGPDVLITAMPDEIGAFLAEYAHDAALWRRDSEQIPFARVR